MARSSFRLMSLIILFLFLASLGAAWAGESAVSPSSEVDYGTGVGKKLGRGIANLAFGWLDILKGIEKVGEENNFIAAITWGPIYGTGNAVVRTLAGAYEVVTFPIPQPAHFEPLVKPEFVLDPDHS